MRNLDEFPPNKQQEVLCDAFNECLDLLERGATIYIGEYIEDYLHERGYVLKEQ